MAFSTNICKANDKSIKSIEKALAKASDVAKYVPSTYQSLQETLAALKESIKHDDPNKTSHDLFMLEEKLRYEKINGYHSHGLRL